MNKSAVLFLIIPILGSISAMGQDSHDVMDLLRQRYARMVAMQASFEQTTSSTFMDDTDRFTGQILLSGDKYRVRTQSQTIVTDGQTVWVYNRTENQVLVSDFIEDETAFSLSTFLRDFDTAYQVASFETGTENGNRFFDLELVPDDPESMFQRVNIRVRASDMMVVRLDVLDLNESEMRFDLSNIRFNPTVSDESFTFAIPDDVEVVDLRDE